MDCILISISAETQSALYLETIRKHNIRLIQFDRCVESLDSYKVLNDNEESSYNVVNITPAFKGYLALLFDHIPGSM